jgi:hypothetical protein
VVPEKGLKGGLALGVKIAPSKGEPRRHHEKNDEEDVGNGGIEVSVKFPFEDIFDLHIFGSPG